MMRNIENKHIFMIFNQISLIYLLSLPQTPHRHYNQLIPLHFVYMLYICYCTNVNNNNNDYFDLIAPWYVFGRGSNQTNICGATHQP